MFPDSCRAKTLQQREGGIAPAASGSGPVEACPEVVHTDAVRYPERRTQRPTAAGPQMAPESGTAAGSPRRRPGTPECDSRQPAACPRRHRPPDGRIADHTPSAAGVIAPPWPGRGLRRCIQKESDRRGRAEDSQQNPLVQPYSNTVRIG